MTTTTTIDLIRHGEPLGGRAYRGNSIDDPLSEKGWEQMRIAIGDICHWDYIVTSPLKRCREFTDEIAEKFEIDVQIEDRLKEIGFGEWEGKTPKELQATRLAEYEAFYRDPVNARPMGAEPLDDFISRTTNAYKEVIKTHEGKHILIVAHAGVIRAIVSHILAAPPASMYRIKVENAGITRILHDQIGTQLVALNTTSID